MTWHELLQGFLPIKPHGLSHVILLDHMTNKIVYISTTTMAMGTKLGRDTTYHQALPLKTLNEPLNTWSRQVT